MNPQVQTKILLVEDSEDDAFFFQLALKGSGWVNEFKHLDNGQSAIAYLGDCPSEELPHFIFLDLKLPGMTGFEVLEWIQQQPWEPRPQVVVLSGSDHDKDMLHTRELGVQHYVVKPITVDEFRHRLSHLPLPSNRVHDAGHSALK